ncbi:hypothetical protein A2159_01230 [Candidatus Woesebacteria bacterium RBG_13_34_9]|uniref:Uncharacterized protein n=1 Tax=Candidatus Woesebacteria bacterium RBG_13_34_9 TaxID=1802477 RepID=A0A1F7X3W4_9BACT|nr:MAG: hypothetical protein A2159_01230 [Candidatus Woesebacteria bacterium RBG_13_34_9]
MDKQYNKFFQVITLTMVFCVVIFILVEIIPTLFSEVNSQTKSDIPLISTEKIEKINISLDERTSIIYPIKVDLFNYEFGKEEPFR